MSSITDEYIAVQWPHITWCAVAYSHHGSLSCTVLASLIIRDVYLLLQMSILLFNGLILPGLQWLTATMVAYAVRFMLL